MAKTRTLTVEGVAIAVTEDAHGDYINLTNMSRAHESGLSVIDLWLRNKSTLEFIGVWETIHNEGFKPVDFDGFISRAGGNTFRVSVKQLTEQANCARKDLLPSAHDPDTERPKSTNPGLWPGLALKSVASPGVLGRRREAGAEQGNHFAG